MTRLFRSFDDAVLPAARRALADLQARGRTHKFIHHVRSSQAFGLSLFAALDEPGLIDVFARLGYSVVAVDPPVFEFEDSTDRMAEASPRSRHQTQVDVMLRGLTDDDTRVAALVEVKLSEPDFGHCSAFLSPDNPSRDVCASPGVFGDDPSRCFQLGNHGRGRRRYADLLSEVPVTEPRLREDGGGCWVRAGRSQPMRNLALAHLLVRDGDVDEVVFALCAPRAHHAMWRRWAEFKNVFGDTGEVTIRDLPAEIVASAHPDGGTEFADRYSPALTNDALLHLTTDGQRLLGVWMRRGGHLESLYAPESGDKAVEYAEALLLDADWHAALERLPSSMPAVAWWEHITCDWREAIEDVYDRAEALIGA